jgi:aspartokinase
MIPENVEEDLLAERDVASVCAASKDTEVGSTPAVRGSLVAFKFGGSSLLGAERMRHAAGLVRPAAQLMEVVVVVSAMKGVTDRLLGIAQTLGERNHERARLEAEALLRLHLDVLRDLALDPDEHDRVVRELHSLGRDS